MTLPVPIGIIHLPGKTSRVGLELPDNLSFEDWEKIGNHLKSAAHSIMWWVGDWLRFGEAKYGEMYVQAIDITDLYYQSLADAKWLAGKYEFSDRSENLSWSHHRVAAELPNPDRKDILILAEANSWSKQQLRREVNKRKALATICGGIGETCTTEDLNDLISSGKKFGTIYADPPWLYDNQGTRASTDNHYAGMAVEQICELPIDLLTAPNAHLHLWTTNGFLFECPKIFAAWGFEFRSSFIWIKPQLGIGNYWRNSHEILLTAIRGDAKRFNDKSLKSWIECDRGAHSAKPEQVRGFIEKASPGPFLELFGRRPSDEWTVWGNQIERNIFSRSLTDSSALEAVDNDPVAGMDHNQAKKGSQNGHLKDTHQDNFGRNQDIAY